MIRHKTSILVLTLSITLPITVWADVITGRSGTCGATDADCHYDITNGVLTITGNGAMTSTPWQSISGYSNGGITSINIQGKQKDNNNQPIEGTGITSIASGAFASMSGVTDITIGDSVTTIGRRAFSDMSNVTGELKIPDSVTTIGEMAFYNMYNITGELKIPDSVTTIGGRAFYNMYNITGELKIPDSVTTIGDYAFYYMSGITSVDMSDNVTSIGTSVFGMMQSLEHIVLGDSVETYGYHPFYYDGHNIPQTVILPDSFFEQEEWPKLYTSDKSKFYCSEKMATQCQEYANSRNFKDSHNSCCVSLNENNLVYYNINDEGLYILKDENGNPIYFSSALNMSKGTDYSCEPAQCKLEIMQSKGYCENATDCQTIIDSFNNNGFATVNGEKYASLSDLYSGNPIPARSEVCHDDGSCDIYKGGVFVGYRGKRIYTVDEAERVSKPTGNTFKLRYK